MKQIPLTKGYVALVDDEDFKELSNDKWFAEVNKSTVYASRNAKTNELVDGKRRVIRMHRQLINPKSSDVHVDHKDGNGLNNQRDNLRYCTTGQNRCNMAKKKSNSSGYKGVSFDKRRRKFNARIMVHKNTIRIGFYESALDAAKAYDDAAIIYHGDFARLNFPKQ